MLSLKTRSAYAAALHAGSCFEVSSTRTSAGTPPASATIGRKDFFVIKFLRPWAACATRRTEEAHEEGHPASAPCGRGRGGSLRGLCELVPRARSFSLVLLAYCFRCRASCSEASAQNVRAPAGTLTTLQPLHAHLPKSPSSLQECQECSFHTRTHRGETDFNISHRDLVDPQDEMRPIQKLRLMI